MLYPLHCGTGLGHNPSHPTYPSIAVYVGYWISIGPFSSPSIKSVVPSQMLLYAPLRHRFNNNKRQQGDNTHSHTHTHTHIHTYTYTHTHIHTYTVAVFLSLPISPYLSLSLL